MKVMQMIPTFLVVVSLFLGSCGGTHSNEFVRAEDDSVEPITMKFGGKEVSFRPNYARFTSFRKGLVLNDSDIPNKDERVSAVVHRLYLANYDLELTNSARQDHQLISSEGQYRVEIQIEADKNAADDAQLQVGEYVYKAKPFERISYVFLSYLKEGKDRSENLQTAEFGGMVTIRSVTNTEIEGEINVFDKNEFVKGNFKAQRLTK